MIQCFLDKSWAIADRSVMTALLHVGVLVRRKTDPADAFSFCVGHFFNSAMLLTARAVKVSETESVYVMDAFRRERIKFVSVLDPGAFEVHEGKTRGFPGENGDFVANVGWHVSLEFGPSGLE
eukprot:3213633-Pyramimonas_sp.AAC.1